MSPSSPRVGVRPISFPSPVEPSVGGVRDGDLRNHTEGGRNGLDLTGKGMDGVSGTPSTVIRPPSEEHVSRGSDPLSSSDHLFRHP